MIHQRLVAWAGGIGHAAQHWRRKRCCNSLFPHFIPHYNNVISTFQTIIHTTSQFTAAASLADQLLQGILRRLGNVMGSSKPVSRAESIQQHSQNQQNSRQQTATAAAPRNNRLTQRGD